MALTWSGPKMTFHIKLAHLLHAKETRPRAPNCSRLQATQSTYTNNYPMTEIKECIGDINSSIFSTRDLTSGLWQMTLGEESQLLTAFTITRCGQLRSLPKQSGRGYLVATATKWRNDSMNNTMQFLKMQLFWAALPAEICHVVAQKDQTNITLDDIYQIATTVQRESGPHTSETITAVKEENEFNKEDEGDVAAFQN